MRLAGGFPKGQNFKVFVDNLFTSYNLICALEVGTLALGTMRVARLPGCTLKTGHESKRLGQGSDYYRTEAEKNIIALK
jgi:hypothetical protein